MLIRSNLLQRQQARRRIRNRNVDFKPARWQTTFTIAANDFQRDLLLREQAPGVALRVIPSDIPSLEMLRNEHCQLVAVRWTWTNGC